MKICLHKNLTHKILCPQNLCIYSTFTVSMALTAKNRSWSSVKVDCKILLEEIDSWACILRKQLCMYMHVVTCFIIIMHWCECAKAYSSQFMYLCVFLYISLKVSKNQLSVGEHSTGTARQYMYLKPIKALSH